MAGFELNLSSHNAPAAAAATERQAATATTTTTTNGSATVPVPVPADVAVDGPAERNVYYNPRLDPKNFLEGPLSLNPSTRLRQMLARPGIVVSITPHLLLSYVLRSLLRSLLEFVTALARAAHWRLASTACTRAAQQRLLPASVSPTLPSRP